MDFLNKIKSLIRSFLHIIGLRKIIHLIRCFVNAFILRNAVLQIDKKSSFIGPLGENGTHVTNISMEVASGLLKNYQRFKNVNKKIYLTNEDQQTIKEIFQKVGPILKEYFGDKVFLDGMSWKQNISDKLKLHDKTDNWHTDSVGCRVKCYICIIGDGTVPTLVVPSKERIPKFFYWLKGVIMEIIRFQGIKNQKFVENFLEIKHKVGSVALFDTQLIHRGGYKKNTNERTALVLEFSNPEKHNLINKYYPGAIGTFDNYNSFTFDKNLVELDVFTQFLDPARLKRDQYNSKYIYSINENR